MSTNTPPPAGNALPGRCHSCLWWDTSAGAEGGAHPCRHPDYRSYEADGSPSTDQGTLLITRGDYGCSGWSSAEGVKSTAELEIRREVAAWRDLARQDPEAALSSLSSLSPWARWRLDRQEVGMLWRRLEIEDPDAASRLVATGTRPRPLSAEEIGHAQRRAAAAWDERARAHPGRALAEIEAMPVGVRVALPSKRVAMAWAAAAEVWPAAALHLLSNLSRDEVDALDPEQVVSAWRRLLVDALPGDLVDAARVLPLLDDAARAQLGADDLAPLYALPELSPLADAFEIAAGA